MSGGASGVARLSMSLPADLFRQLDLMVEERQLPSRSQLIAELIRQALTDHEASARPEEVLAGTVTLVYERDHAGGRNPLAQAQADYQSEVISSQHVFLANGRSLEVLVVQGPAMRLNALCDALRSERRVLQVELVATAALLHPLGEPKSDSPVGSAP